MSKSRKRNAWGGVRELPSGRFQAHYRVDGQWYSGPTTFGSRRDAEGYLASVRVDIDRGSWTDPISGKVSLEEYAKQWIAENPRLRPRTVELYRILLRRHIFPYLGLTGVGRLTPRDVRRWHATLISDNRGHSTIAKSYRLLHTILQTAVHDGHVARNPCNLKGAGVERPAERPVISIDQVYQLANLMPEPFDSMTLLATFAGMRLGELRALRWKNLDLHSGVVVVTEQIQQLSNGTLVVGPPKTQAGFRRIHVPQRTIADLKSRLRLEDEVDGEHLVFTGQRDQPVRLATLYRAWARATATLGLEGLHFHDLRHTGNTLAAATGASTKELMSRMGHASARAALIYQHATRERDVAIAAGLDAAIARTLPEL